MLKITLHDSAGELRFRLEGRLSGAWVGELRQCWQTAQSTVRSRGTTVDLKEVDYVDADGQSLLTDMYQHGVVLKADTPPIRENAVVPLDATLAGYVFRSREGRVFT